jgi:6-phosphogluconolactonase
MLRSFCWRFDSVLHRSLALLLCTVLLGAAAAGAQDAPRSGSVRVYVGTFTSGESKGIYRLRLDLASGALTPEGEPTPADNPSFLAIDSSNRFLYAVNETGAGRSGPAGKVSAYAIDAQSGELTLLNQQSSLGSGPTYIALDRAGRNALVANFGGGTVVALPIGPDGKLGPARSRQGGDGKGPRPEQDAPHAHSINADFANRFAVQADLGLDKLFVYRLDAERGDLTPASTAQVAPGSGPRHFAFAPNGTDAYVINEFTSQVTVFDYNSSTGTLTQKQSISALPPGFSGQSFGAEVVVRPDGKFVYVSNRGADSIAVFGVNGANGQLTLLENESTQGEFPRGFAIDPTSSYLLAANQRTSSVIALRIDPQTGLLDPVGRPVRVPTPTAIRFTAPSGAR